MSPHTRILFVGAILFVTCLSSSNANLINNVCAKASNPSSCGTILRSNPLAVQAKDMPSLGSITIGIAQAFSNSAKALANSLAQTTTDPKIKGSLSTCVRGFDHSMVNLDACKKALQEKDKEALSDNALEASANANTCNSNFEGLVEPPNVVQATQNVKDACGALLAISKLL